MKLSEDKIKEIITSNYNINNITKAQIKDLSTALGVSQSVIKECIDQIFDAIENNGVEEKYIDKFHQLLAKIELMRPYIESLRSEQAQHIDPARKARLLERHED